MVICRAGHHVCFSCLLRLLHHDSYPACPLCREQVQLLPQGHLLQQLIPAALQDFAGSEPFGLYLQLQQCQYFRSSPSLDQCRQMARIWLVPDNRCAAQHLVATWHAYTEAMHELERKCGATCDDDSSEDTTTDSDVA